MKIYTKTGDKGQTSLFDGTRTGKADLRVETYGTVDELNSFIGVAIANDAGPIKKDLCHISNELFTLGTDLASPYNSEYNWEVPRIDEKAIEWLEFRVDKYTAEMPPLKGFILPGGAPAAAYLHVARTVCRRAERLLVTLCQTQDCGPYALKYLNRLSDYLFTAARYINFKAGKADILKQ